MILTANGDFLVKPEVVGMNADTFIVYVSGSIDGAVMQLRYKDEGGNWVNLENGLLVIDTQNKVEAGRGAYIHLNISNAGASTEIFVTTRGLN